MGHVDSAAVVAWWCQTFPAVVATANISASDNANRISRVFLFPRILIRDYAPAMTGVTIPDCRSDVPLGQ